MIRVAIAFLAWFAMGVGVAAAQVGPVDATTKQLIASVVSLSVFQNGQNITNTFLPTPGQTVEIVVNGLANATIALRCPDGSTNSTGTCPDGMPETANPITANVVQTSAYPGRCTNVDNVAPLSLYASDFQLVGNLLTSTDCGGMAVIVVNPGPGELTFILPQDTNFDGVPDIFAAGFPPVAPDADPDVDGLSAFDEYRGFIVSGRHVRGNPTQKDLFIHVRNPADTSNGAFIPSPSCGVSCIGGGTVTYPAPTIPNATLTLPPSAITQGALATFTASAAVFNSGHAKGEIIGVAAGRARIVSVLTTTSVTAEVTAAFAPNAVSLAAGQWRLTESLFANAYTLVPPERLHVLGHTPGATNAATSEWVDSFVSLVPAQTLTLGTTDPPDRTINRNRLYGPVQRGIRVMDATNTASSSVLGYAFGVASPNFSGNIIIFTQRIINYLNTLFTTDLVRYSNFVNGAWTAPLLVPDGDPATTSGDGQPNNLDVKNFIATKAMQFFVGMELAHSLDLTPTTISDNRVSYGYHFAPFTGDCVDQGITTKVKGGFNTFYIPSACGSTDQAQFLISP